MLILLQSIADDYDILILQEPWIDSVGNTRANSHWPVYYPSTKPHEGHPPLRTVTLINTKIPSDPIQQIDLPSSDITVIKITSITHSVTIYNIYNDCNHNDTMTALARHMDTELPTHVTTDTDHFLLLGDLNRHHPLWESPANEALTSTMEANTPLLDIIMDHGLEMILPHDIPTLETFRNGNWTCPDNTFRSPNEFNPLVSCTVEASMCPDLTDHLPIVTVLQFPTIRPTPKPYRSYRNVKWDEFRATLTTRLPPVATAENLATQELLDDAVLAITEALKETTTKHVPLSKSVPSNCHWWTHDLTTKRKKRNRLSNCHYQWRGIPHHLSHKEYREAVDAFVKKI
jgi:hypothetical protein